MILSFILWKILTSPLITRLSFLFPLFGEITRPAVTITSGQAADCTKYHLANSGPGETSLSVVLSLGLSKQGLFVGIFRQSSTGGAMSPKLLLHVSWILPDVWSYQQLFPSWIIVWTNTWHGQADEVSTLGIFDSQFSQFTSLVKSLLLPLSVYASSVASLRRIWKSWNFWATQELSQELLNACAPSGLRALSSEALCADVSAHFLTNYMSSNHWVSNITFRDALRNAISNVFHVRDAL